MPYVDENAKDALKYNPHEAKTEGELTYVLTECLINYLDRKGVSYAHLAQCMGALHGAMSDFERRIVWPYEERKQQDNGDVWPEDILKQVGGQYLF